MNNALRAIAVPKLRELGFSGRFPHFRRVHQDRADLLVFQFNRAGGSFVVEITTLTSQQVASHWKAELSLNTATAYDAYDRHRLGSVGHGDHWFVFGKRTYISGHDRVEADIVYERIAQNVVELLDSEAAQWWRGA